MRWGPSWIALLVLGFALAACGRVPDHAQGAALESLTCWQCHSDRYARTTSPDHVARGIPQACEGCHTTVAWRPATAGDHDLYWPLTGRHVAATCASCHVDGVYAGTPRECVGCHRPQFEATTDPDHELGAFPVACQGCHDTNAWRPAGFDHAGFWPLEGKHVEATCEGCHANGVYAGTPRACEGCHLPDYQATSSPDHESARIATACAGCHTAAGWRPAGLAAHEQYWPLAGRHATVTCESCHADGRFAGTPRACAGCHQDDYDLTQRPAHGPAGFPTTCETCHGVSAWTPSTFDHAAIWPLRGRHATTACASCHEGGVYGDTPRACFSCHAADYTASANPPHATLDLAKTCEGCHDEAAWATERFAGHDALFPISNERHSWPCRDCHDKPATSWASFSCTGCHTGEHRAAEVAAEHQEVSSYGPTVTSMGPERACLHCHPQGRGD